MKHVSLVNRLTWLAVSGVVVIYLLTLGYSVLRARSGKGVVAAAPAITTPVFTNVAPAVPTDDPIAERIRVWKNGPRSMETAVGMERDGKFPEAQDQLESALKESPSDIAVRFALARLLMRAKQYEAARIHLVQIVAADPGNLDARQSLAAALAGLDRNEESRQVAEWILETDKYASDAHRLAAEASLNMGRPDQAIDHLRKLVDANRNDKWARTNLGIAYLKTGQISDARKIFDTMLKDDVTDSAAYFNLAICDARGANAERVVETLSKAASAFGAPFITSWLSSGEFDGVRTSEVFVAFQNHLNDVEPAPAPAAAEAPVADAVAPGG